MNENRREAAGQISSKWHCIEAKATMKEEVARNLGDIWPNLSAEVVEDAKARRLDTVEARLHVLPTPIWVSADPPKSILSFKSGGRLVRVYPPFLVNEQDETKSALSSVDIPMGDKEVSGGVSVPESAVQGVHAKAPSSGAWCRGIRIDMQNGTDEMLVLRSLLDHTSQYTHQWWIRAPYNPLRGSVRLGASMAKGFKIEKELRYAGAGAVVATWYGALAFQFPLGFGEMLTESTWQKIGHSLQGEAEADLALLSFYDGMANFMAGDDRKAILNLCISLEVALSKHQLLVLKKPLSKLERMLNSTPLVDKEVRQLLSFLSNDRNCVAHGREPEKIRREKDVSIPAYIVAVLELLASYLTAMGESGVWPEAMAFNLKQEHSRRAS